MLDNNIMALDVGDVRVGVALARSDVRLAVPQPALARQADDFWQLLTAMIQSNDVGTLVIGLPRGLNGQNTAQTIATQAFGKQAEQLGLPIVWQDEALTSQKAEASLKATGKPYEKADIDSLAACYILNDYLESNQVHA